MSSAFIPGVGAVMSADIAVPEHDREVRFYARVLGTGDTPLWRDDLMNNRGMPVIGLGPMSPEYADLPRQWMPHIQVADVDASVARARPLGGRVLMQQQGAWAVLLDPNGAAFGLIPVVDAAQMPSPPDASADDAPVGRIAWLDLTVVDASRTRDFYRDVIGWQTEDVAMKDDAAAYADYNMLGSGGTPAAGVCHARGGNTGLSPVWMLYLPVGDLAESLRRVEDEGGKVVKSMRGGDGATVYAAVADPVGAHFALVQAQEAHMSSPELTRLAIFRSVADAQLAKGLLDAADIDSMIRTDDAGGMYVGISGAELLVRAEDVEAARAALDDAELAEGTAPEGDEADSTD